MRSLLIGLGVVFLGLGVLFLGSKVAGPGAPKEAVVPIASPLPAKAELMTVRVQVSGEKYRALQDKQVQERLLSTHYLRLDVRQAPSYEMVDRPDTTLDVIWPSTDIGIDRYRYYIVNSSGARVPTDRGNRFCLYYYNLANTPLVLYAQEDVVPALMVEGLVEQIGDVYYTADFGKLVAMVQRRQDWRQLKQPPAGRTGPIYIKSTDPVKDEAGLMWSVLVLNNLLADKDYSQQNIATALPALNTILGRGNTLAPNSASLMQEFMAQGLPLIAAFENQLTEFSIEQGKSDPKVVELIRKKLRPIYPRPTIFATNPAIALSCGPGTRLAEAFAEDPELRKLLWEAHGLRSGLMGVQNDPSVLGFVGIPAEVKSTAGIPNFADIMSVVLEQFTGRPLDK